MPQLIPFYFINLLIYGMTTILGLLYLVSRFLLPNILRLQLARTIIAKL